MEELLILSDISETNYCTDSSFKVQVNGMELSYINFVINFVSTYTFSSHKNGQISIM
jgi:hypothetical protein